MLQLGWKSWYFLCVRLYVLISLSLFACVFVLVDMWRSDVTRRRVCVCRAAVNWTLVPLCASVFDSDLYETCSLTHICVCFLSLSHSNVCPPTGQCPNGLSCFPSLSLCKYSGSPSDFTRTGPRSVHACLNAKHTHTQCDTLYTSVFTSHLFLLI